LIRQQALDQILKLENASTWNQNKNIPAMGMSIRENLGSHFDTTWNEFPWSRHIKLPKRNKLKGDHVNRKHCLQPLVQPATNALMIIRLGVVDQSRLPKLAALAEMTRRVIKTLWHLVFVYASTICLSKDLPYLRWSFHTNTVWIAMATITEEKSEIPNKLLWSRDGNRAVFVATCSYEQ
jgi:hypothetical protein